MDYIFGQVWKLQNKISNGSFGDIFKSKNIQNSQQAAIKLQPVASQTNQLLKQSAILKLIQNLPGVPRVYWYGTHSGFNALVLQLLGPSLEAVFNACRHSFSMKTILMIADQVLSRIQMIHSHSVIHRDIKPQNFLIGTAQNANMIYLIDFGLAQKFKSKTQGHLQYRENLGFLGNLKYSSVNSLIGVQQSRRDDLESIGYMLIYFSRGFLPWDTPRTHKSSSSREQLTWVKLNTTLESLCDGLPTQFTDYFLYVKQLKFEQKPNYGYLRNLFRDLYNRLNYTYDWNFDWCGHHLYITAAQRKVRTPKKNEHILMPVAEPFQVSQSSQSNDCLIM